MYVHYVREISPIYSIYNLFPDKSKQMEYPLINQPCFFIHILNYMYWYFGFLAPAAQTETVMVCEYCYLFLTGEKDKDA